MTALKVIELFAGVGGFHLGLCGTPGKKKKFQENYEVVWSNQWEPSRKVQHASDIYVREFKPQQHSNEDIEQVIEKSFDEIPDHDLLVGGFPCQDYSVARTLNQATGIIGKKGVLWWSIYNILEKKKTKPQYLLLENVDRMLKSPATQRGRDFAIMLSSLANLGYAVEWRVINAADYGFPQRRRRVFLVGYHRSSPIYKKILHLIDKGKWLEKSGVLAKAFKPKPLGLAAPMFSKVNLHDDLVKVTEEFNVDAPNRSPFQNAGLMFAHEVWTETLMPDNNGNKITLGDVLLDNGKVPGEYYIPNEQLEKWKYFKGAKSIQRVSKRTGATYTYDEGNMSFPDSLDKPSRTIITGEGGKSPSRFKHVVKTESGRYRRLTPIELERLNGFPDNHTKGAPDTMRAFMMGNALVVGVVEKIGRELLKAIEES